jgi:hypothetical protein
MLLQGTLLLLLFTHQAWAGIIFHCAHESESQHVCCQTAHHSEHTAGTDAHTLSSAPCSDESEPPSDGHRRIAPQGEEGCCYLSSQAEAQTVAISLLNPVPVEDVAPVFDVTGLKTSMIECVCVSKRRRSRPLYLTHSSLLI